LEIDFKGKLKSAVDYLCHQDPSQHTSLKFVDSFFSVEISNLFELISQEKRSFTGHILRETWIKSQSEYEEVNLEPNEVFLRNSDELIDYQDPEYLNQILGVLPVDFVLNQKIQVHSISQLSKLIHHSYKKHDRFLLEDISDNFVDLISTEIKDYKKFINSKRLNSFNSFNKT
jgi:hypothetical protein